MLEQFDIAILQAINGAQNPVATAVAVFASGVTEYSILWTLLACVAVLFDRAGGKRILLGWLACLGLCLLCAFALHAVWERPRPYMTLDDVTRVGILWTNPSFPSGHAVTSFGAAAFFAGRYRRMAAPLYGFAGLVGISRVYCGMHYPSDVLIGTLAGLAVGRLVRALGARIVG